jgi:hypothetical protein
MTGQNTFENIVAFAERTNQPRSLISQEDYKLWEKDVIWDALHGQRYGQSFCNRFGIIDNLLYYSSWPPEQMEDYIRKHYIDGS